MTGPCGKGPGFRHFRVQRQPGKKATRCCPCGFRLSARDCRCDDAALARYEARLSGPLLDRIDLHVTVPAVSWQDLLAAPTGPESPCVAARVQSARQRQRFRLRSRGLRLNAEIPAGALDELVCAGPEARALLGRAVDRLGLSARGAHRILRVARTVADLAGDAEVGAGAVAEALDFRRGEVAAPEGMSDFRQT